MKPIKIDLPEDVTQIEIVPLADVHLGDTHCAYREFRKVLDYIENTPNVYTILNGDLMNSAITSSISDTYSETIPPMVQLSQCVKLFEPIKDKILCVVPGNHEGRHYKTNGVDITELMCNQLGIGDRYSPTTAILFIRLGMGKINPNCRERPVFYSIYCTHGSGGGKREGGKINRVADLAGIVDADIYLHSHTHLPAVFKEAFYRVSNSNSSVSLVDKLFVNTNAFLEYGGYGDAAGFKPASVASPHIFLDGTKKYIYATL